MGEDSISVEEQKILLDLRARGFCVCIWSPSELVGLDPIKLEDTIAESVNEILVEIRAG